MAELKQVCIGGSYWNYFASEKILSVSVNSVLVAPASRNLSV